MMIGRMSRHPQQHIAMVEPRVPLQAPQIIVRHVIEKHGKGGFRQHNQSRRRLLCQFGVNIQGVPDAFAIPFGHLFDVALHQGHRQRRA